MQGKLDHYNLTTPLAKKYSHSTYLSTSIDDPERQVIVIMFSPSLFSSPRERKDFLQKAQCLKDLQHPHILPLLDVDVEGEQRFIVRDYLPDGSLRSRLKQLSSERLELHDALTIILQVGEALAYAHQQNIFHGNLKPENILFDTNGQVLLTDFHFISRKDAIIRDQVSEEYAFCYMAPEQFVGRTDAGSDQYALGCLTYELITGQLPFIPQSLASMMSQPNYTLPTPLSEYVADLPSALEAAIFKALAKDPAERFFDLSQFLDVIQGILSPQPAFPFSRSKTLHAQNAISYPTHSLKSDATFSSSGQSVASSRSEPKTSEVTVSSDVEHDRAEPVDTSAEASVPETASANSLDDLFTHLFADSLPTHSSLEQESPKSSTNQRETIRGLEMEEMTVPLLNPNGRDSSLERKIQPERRKIFWLVSFGFLIVALVFTAWNSKTVFQPVPVKRSMPTVSVYQKSTQAIIPTLVSTVGPNLPTTATIQAEVSSPSTTPTASPTTSSPTTIATSTSSYPRSSPTPKPTPKPTPTLRTTTIDDAVQGTGSNQFNYVGGYWYHSGSECPGPNCSTSSPSYGNTSSWDSQVNEYVTLSFTGVRIKLYGVVDPMYGIGAVSIDGGAETMVDFYASAHGGNQLLWTSPTLSAGTHTFKLRVTGNYNPNARPDIGCPIVLDRVDILG